ncbi:MAG TPA: serine/threonine-protein kinase [Acidimicrobiales bacterium]|nr:serine/threonine-protein kinase [Acidimicrobiales bacterium]
MEAVPTPTQLAGRYQVGEVLGRGGMAEVRDGFDTRLGRPVAIKFLRPDMAELDGVRERFQAEARAAAALVHPNVVAVFDTGEHMGLPYIVMERLPGQSLADEIARGPLEPERVRRLAREVLAALDAAHRAGIVHRDVKPGNVLLAPDGVAKVGDFGIAKGAEALDLTFTGQLVGTPAYLAPERVEGEPATPRSDLYAVAVMLYEALCGRRPFVADTPAGLLHAINRLEPAPLEDLCPGGSPPRGGGRPRGMEKDPARRFPDAAAMAAVLGADGDAVAAAVDPTVALEPPREESGPPTATEVGSPSALGVRRRGIDLRLLRVAVAVALVVMALVMIAVLATRGGDDDPAPAPTTTAVPQADASVPEPLQRALDQLDQAVRP